MSKNKYTLWMRTTNAGINLNPYWIEITPRRNESKGGELFDLEEVILFRDALVQGISSQSIRIEETP